MLFVLFILQGGVIHFSMSCVITAFVLYTYNMCIYTFDLFCIVTVYVCLPMFIIIVMLLVSNMLCNSLMIIVYDYLTM